MIHIKITKSTVATWTQKENVIAKETPTDKKDDYNRALMAKEYVVMDVDKRETKESVLLSQEVEDSEFDLKAVISAINNLQKPQP